MQKAIILARVSTQEQQETGLSLDKIQLPQLRQYAIDNGFTVAPEHEFVFQETASQKLRKKLNEGKLEYNLQKPFDSIFETAKSLKWGRWREDL
ncbi:MAG: hypothetical protein ACOCXT_01670 [Candidatus Dojkabacteria bacterium]